VSNIPVLGVICACSVADQPASAMKAMTQHHLFMNISFGYNACCRILGGVIKSFFDANISRRRA
jgi:hypothetical protein